jgi:hypothetical protein
MVLSVNGVPAQPLCANATLTLQQPGQPATAAEPATVDTANGTCAYVYSAQMTPTLLALPGTVGGILPPSFLVPNTVMSLYGIFLVGSDASAASSVAVTVGGAACTGVAVGPGPSGSTNLNCSIPFLPTGTYPVNILVSGLGSTRPPTTVAKGLPTITYQAVSPGSSKSRALGISDLSFFLYQAVS